MPTRLMLVLSAALLLLAACSATSSAEPAEVSPTPTEAPPTPENPSAGSPGLSDPYFPNFGNGGYDVEHYLLDLDVDMDLNEITGRALITARATQDLKQINLDFIGMTISALSVNGVSADYERDGRELSVQLPPTAEGQQFEVEVSYSGTPGEGIDASGLSAYELGWVYYGDGIYVAGEPSGSSTWYPVNEHPSDKALYSYEITVAEPYVAAANGTLQEVIEGDGANTYVWTSADPIASYLVTVAIGEFDVEEEQGPNGLPIRNYFGKDVSRFVRDDFEDTAEMLALFNELFGPYPFEAYGVVVHDLDLRFALETQTLSVFGRSFTTPEVVSHELAHAWFGNSVTLANWNEIWLNEGFATYASVLWEEHALGRAAADASLADMYAGMAPGQLTYELTRSELAGGLRNILPVAAFYELSDTQAALQALFGNALSAEDLAALEADPLGAPDIAAFISGLSTRTFRLPESRLAAFFEALGELEIAAEFSSVFPVPGDPGAEDVFSRVVYHRGALTLHALRLEIGDEAFFNTLRAYAERYRNSIASTRDFVTIAEEMSGRDLDELFEDWLFDSQIPDIPEMGLFYADYALE